MVTKFLIRKAFKCMHGSQFHTGLFWCKCSLNNSNTMVAIFTMSSTFSSGLFYTYLWGVSCMILRSLWKHLKPSQSQQFSIICSLRTTHQIILHDFTSGGRMVVPHNVVPRGTAWYITFLCLRTEGAGGIMFPGCPSVRPDVCPDFRPDFYVYAITQVLLNGISSNLVQGSTTRSRWTD